MGVDGSEILFVDDREENIRACEAAGMLGIVYSNHEDFSAVMAARGLGGLLKIGN